MVHSDQRQAPARGTCSRYISCCCSARDNCAPQLAVRATTTMPVCCSNPGARCSQNGAQTPSPCRRAIAASRTANTITRTARSARARGSLRPLPPLLLVMFFMLALAGSAIMNPGTRTTTTTTTLSGSGATPWLYTGSSVFAYAAQDCNITDLLPASPGYFDSAAHTENVDCPTSSSVLLAEGASCTIKCDGNSTNVVQGASFTWKCDAGAFSATPNATCAQSM